MFCVLFDVIEANNHTFTISIIISANPVCMEIYLDLMYTSSSARVSEHVVSRH